MTFASLRKEYLQRGIDAREFAADPIAQFQVWFQDAVAARLTEPNAMTLATVGADGRPSARIVLLKGVDARGFVFYTNYAGRKGRDIAVNPWVSLCFYWPGLERQVRVEGQATPVDPAESDAYFAERPRESRLGAWASAQSAVIANRELLEERMTELHAEYAEREIPRPPHWGGFRVAPDIVEFWQGRPNRLHDRLRYRLDGTAWVIERLSP